VSYEGATILDAHAAKEPNHAENHRFEGGPMQADQAYRPQMLIGNIAEFRGFDGHGIVSSMAKNPRNKRPEADVWRDAILKRMLATPPKPFTPKRKGRPASKGRVHKGKTKS